MCIIPVSAHGTNPASAAMCGMKIVAVGTDAKGNINIEELRKAAEANKDKLAALMVNHVLLLSDTFMYYLYFLKSYYINFRLHTHQHMESMRKESMRYVR